ncbi:AKTIP protein, partial [Polypterus senegalus]
MIISDVSALQHELLQPHGDQTHLANESSHAVPRSLLRQGATDTVEGGRCMRRKHGGLRKSKRITIDSSGLVSEVYQKGRNALEAWRRSDSEEKSAPGEQRSSPSRSSFGKKQLPCIPKNAVPITKPMSPSASAPSTNGTHASYGPFYLEYSLLAEFTLVIKQKLPGIYVQPSYKSALSKHRHLYKLLEQNGKALKQKPTVNGFSGFFAVWFGVIFIRHGLYQDGVFKFTVYIPDNYPDGDCPRVVFDIPVFHPLVNPESGELDVKRAFAKWRRNHNHIWQVLMYARTVFYKIQTVEPLNPEAAVLYEKDVQLFKSKVVDSVKLCNSHLFDQPKIDDPYAISFSPWNPTVHEEARQRMFVHRTHVQRHSERQGHQQSSAQEGSHHLRLHLLCWLGHVSSRTNDPGTFSLKSWRLARDQREDPRCATRMSADKNSRLLVSTAALAWKQKVMKGLSRCETEVVQKAAAGRPMAEILSSISVLLYAVRQGLPLHNGRRYYTRPTRGADA